MFNPYADDKLREFSRDEANRQRQAWRPPDRPRRPSLAAGFARRIGRGLKQAGESLEAWAARWPAPGA